MDKIKVQINGFNYTLPNGVVSEHNGKKRISVGAKNTAVMLRQYLKANYPSLESWVTSEVYSGGSSVRVYISNKDGSKVENRVYREIESFADAFEAGDFDGMTDSYNYREHTVSDFGTEVSFNTRYIFVENKPKWGTLEYYMREAIDKGVEFKESMKSQWMKPEEQELWVIKYDAWKEKYYKIKK